MNRTRAFVLAGLLVALLLGGVVSFYASSEPDGLNKVAADTGFADREQESAASGSPLAGYSTQGVEDERLSGGLAVGAGVLVCFALGTVLTLVVRRRGTAQPAAEVGPADRHDPAGDRHDPAGTAP